MWLLFVFLKRSGKVKCNLLTCECIQNKTRTRNGNNTQRRSKIAAHWTEDSFFQHLDGRSKPRKPHAVIWMTRLLRVNGHRSAELCLFLTVVVNGHVLIALLLSIIVVVRRVSFPQTWSFDICLHGMCDQPAAH